MDGWGLVGTGDAPGEMVGRSGGGADEIGPDVGDGVEADAEDGAVVEDGGLGAALHTAAMVGDHVLAAVFNPLDGAAEANRHIADGGHVGAEVFASKTAAHVRGNDADSAGVTVEDKGEEVAVVVDGLGGAPDGQEVVGRSCRRPRRRGAPWERGRCADCGRCLRRCGRHGGRRRLCRHHGRWC